MSRFGQWSFFRRLAVIVPVLTVLGLLIGFQFTSSSAISLPTGNLLKNPSFESWTNNVPNYWTAYNSDTRFAKSTTAYAGTDSVKISTTSKTSATSGINDGTTPNVSSTVVGATYTASCWTRVSKSIKVTIQLHELTHAGVSVKAAATSSLSISNTSNWNQLTVSYTAAANGDKLPLSIYSANTVSGGATFLVDDCSLTVADTTPPTMPGGLTAKAVSPTQINLSWTASTDNVGVSSYEVLRNNSVIASVAGTSTTYSDNTTSPATTYNYSVIALDAAGNQSPAAVVTATTLPLPPTGLKVPSPTQTPTLNWNTTTGATGYNIYRDGLKVGTSTTTTYSDTAASGGNHSYSVTAVDSGGESTADGSGSVLVDRTPPTITYSLSPVSSSNGWNNQPVIVSFSCVDNAGGSGIATCSSPITLTNDGANQTVSGTAVDNAGNVTTIITGAINLDQTPPTLGSPSWSGNPITVDTNATLSVPVSDGLSGVAAGEYFVGNFDPGQGNGTAMTLNSGNLTASLGANLSPGTYTINVRARDVAGNWSPVTTSSLTIIDQPASTPTNLVAYATSPTQIDLLWSGSTAGSSPVVGYQVYRNGLYIATVRGLSYKDIAASPGATDSYYVMTVDGYGVVSPASNTAADTTPPNTTTPYTLSEWDTALGAVIHADVAQSVTLPNGNILWTFGDTTQVNGQSTVGYYGYPHSAFVTQAPGTLNFTAVPGSYGYGWQPVPNWSDGTFFWMSTPVVDNGTLYVIGERIQASGGSFSVVGNYIAAFNAQTLAYESITALPNGNPSAPTVWGGVTQGTNGSTQGWWVMGTHQVACSNATDCTVGDAAFIPLGSLGDPTAWQVQTNLIPATLNVGDSLAPTILSSGQWVVYTKLGGPYGSNSIEELTAPTISGPWTSVATWPAPYPTGAVTYGVWVHSEQASPVGQLLLSYDVNGGDSANYHPSFQYVPFP